MEDGNMAADEGDWVARTASEVIAEAELRAPGKPVVCASGISPSGPIHLGNLREVMVPHLVADEIRRRGVEVEHILSWDDFDRLRKIPQGVPESFASNVGQPLTSVPDPSGQYANWAERYKAGFRASLERLGIEVREISQTAMYTSGAYTESILTAMDASELIDATLSRYRTLAKDTNDEGEDEKPSYFPYRPYCHSCGRDTTVVDAYQREPARIDYHCTACGHIDVDALGETTHGKLVWKVDWPMRWAYEGVVFEPGGVDHSSPGSSYTVGSQIVSEIFGGAAPRYVGYAFVGLEGTAKMSSSTGKAQTPDVALRVLEAPILRWLYARRRPNQAIKIDLGQEVVRLYNEWDKLTDRVGKQVAEPGEISTYQRSIGTARVTLPTAPVTVPFGMLTSIVDVTADDDAQIARVLGRLHGSEAPESLAEVEPRLGLARTWLNEQVDPAERTRVRETPDADALAALAPADRAALDLLLDQLDRHWSLDGVTALVYGVSKLEAGLALDAAPTPEIKARQKEFFVLLYRLLVDAERGPRLPTLMLAIGRERLHALLRAEQTRS
jgi:lysyl-tRNA synthetase class 1